MKPNRLRFPLAALALGAMSTLAADTSGLPCDAPSAPRAIPTAADSTQPIAHDNAIVRNAQALWEQNQLPGPQELRYWLQHPASAPLQLSAPSSTPLSSREIAKRAAASHLRIGWVFQCSKCANWHTQLAGAFAITRDSIATARHILTRPDRMKDEAGYPVVVRGADEVLIISGVLGADTVSDSAVLRLKTTDLKPLPLNPEVEVGDAVFCLSDPTGEPGYFSAGIVNRFAMDPGAKSSGQQGRRINVSTDWAPGSSGSAVLDSCANVIGHVGSITSINSQPKGNEAPSHYMAVHWAIPAGHVLKLINQKGDAQK